MGKKLIRSCGESDRSGGDSDHVMWGEYQVQVGRVIMVRGDSESGHLGE